MQQALYWTLKDNYLIECELCPHFCKIQEGKTGICRVRKNVKGVLYALTYGAPCSINLDPIEKKPLYHFFPGWHILSIGTLGCNLQCQFCQNSEISQAFVNENINSTISPKQILDQILKNQDNIGIAFTYNEPGVFIEYMLDIARLAKENNKKNVMVSNGYINQKPLKHLLRYIDAFNIDLKAFNENFFKTFTHSQMSPVLDTLKTIKAAGKHLEITNLVIPTLNDNENDFLDMINWISTNLGKDTVLHLSRYFPRYKMEIPPTPQKTLEKLYKIARENLNYVYLGNISVPGASNTVCPNCNKTLIGRDYYMINTEGINEQGKCTGCGEKVINHHYMM